MTACLRGLKLSLVLDDLKRSIQEKLPTFQQRLNHPLINDDGACCDLIRFSLQPCLQNETTLQSNGDNQYFCTMINDGKSGFQTTNREILGTVNGQQMFLDIPYNIHGKELLQHREKNYKDKSTSKDVNTIPIIIIISIAVIIIFVILFMNRTQTTP